MNVSGTGKSISTMRVIFTLPTCQVNIVLCLLVQGSTRWSFRGSGTHVLRIDHLTVVTVAIAEIVSDSALSATGDVEAFGGNSRKRCAWI
jgi:hypothetical protein